MLGPKNVRQIRQMTSSKFEKLPSELRMLDILIPVQTGNAKSENKMFSFVSFIIYLTHVRLIYLLTLAVGVGGGIYLYPTDVLLSPLSL